MSPALDLFAAPRRRLVWCLTCEHVHIAEIPAMTYRCDPDRCGFGSWELDVAVDHAARYPDHVVFPISHHVEPVVDR